MEEFYLNEIEKMETKRVVKNLEWFYHGFEFERAAEILSNGVLAKKHLPQHFSELNFGNNGKHYISLSKDIKAIDTAFNNYKRISPLVIIDNIKAIKCYRKYCGFENTILPFRYSPWPDEYQVYSKILPDKFIGIECMVYDWSRCNNLFLLRRFRWMLEEMKSLDVQLPIYDFSREEDNMVHELDKEAFLELSEHMLYKK